MDIATLIGLVGAFGLVITTIFMGGNAAGFVDVPSVVVVIGGTFCRHFCHVSHECRYRYHQGGIEDTAFQIQ